MKSKPGSAAQNVLVSIVDDDAAMRSSMRRLMRAFGFQTEGFASAHEFLTSNRAHDTACLILDVRMPGMDGLALQHCLTEIGSDVPIIFLTGNANDSDQRQALEGGATDFLRKPVGALTLVSAIEGALRHRWQQREREREVRVGKSIQI
jgi:FixJ family two-component response regulator